MHVQRVAGLAGFEALESQHIWTLAPGILIATLHIRVEVRPFTSHHYYYTHTKSKSSRLHNIFFPFHVCTHTIHAQDSTDEDRFLAGVYQIMEHAVEHLTVQVNKRRIGEAAALLSGSGLTLEDEGVSIANLSSVDSSGSGVIVLLYDEDHDGGTVEGGGGGEGGARRGIHIQEDV